MEQTGKPPQSLPWETQSMADNALNPEDIITDKLMDDEAVMLVTGKNMFGDPIYSYLKFTMKSFTALREAMIAGENFLPSNYGTVIAAGRGNPSPELKEEMRLTYGLVDVPKAPPMDGSIPADTVKPNNPPASAPITFFGEDEGF